MGVSIKRQLGDELSFRVSGDFGFEAARELLLLSRQCWKGNGGTLTVELDGVVGVSSSAVGALILVQEMVGPGGRFSIQVNRCAGEVQQLFDSGILDRYFRSGAVGGPSVAPSPAEALPS